MNSAAFQLNKVRRLIKTQGRSALIVRPATNKFGEPEGEADVCTILGVFHESSSKMTYQAKTTSDGSTIRAKAAPMMLCLWEDVQDLRHTDHVVINNHAYIIGEIKNVNESNLVADISLEEVQNSDQRISV